MLADTIPSWRASNVCLEFFGREAITLARFRETFHFPVIHFYTQNGVSVDELLARKDEGNAVFQTSYEKMAAKCRTRSGARELLEFLKARDFDCIILSNYQTDKIRAHLKRLKIEHYFSFVSAHDCDGTTILQSTTKKERLSEFMVKRGYRPADTVIIGDSMEEPEIARALGLKSIGIYDGCISRERLREAGPDHLVRHLRDVQVLV